MRKDQDKVALQLRRARTLIETEGELVIYREEVWFYLRRPGQWTRKAIARLEAAGKLKRWSPVTRDLVQFLD